jgi:hypothetical protein
VIGSELFKIEGLAVLSAGFCVAVNQKDPSLVAVAPDKNRRRWSNTQNYKNMRQKLGSCVFLTREDALAEILKRLEVQVQEAHRVKRDPMIIHTAQIRIAHPARLDITRSGVDRLLQRRKAAPGAFLAPSAALLHWYRRERDRAKAQGEGPATWAVWDKYKADYRAEVAANIAKDRSALDALLLGSSSEVVLVCFCGGEDAARGRCHRFVAASILVDHGATRGAELPVVAAPVQAVESRQLGLFGGGR